MELQQSYECGIKTISQWPSEPWVQMLIPQSLEWEWLSRVIVPSRMQAGNCILISLLLLHEVWNPIPSPAAFRDCSVKELQALVQCFAGWHWRTLLGYSLAIYLGLGWVLQWALAASDFCLGGGACHRPCSRESSFPKHQEKDKRGSNSYFMRCPNYCLSHPVPRVGGK